MGMAKLLLPSLPQQLSGSENSSQPTLACLHPSKLLVYSANPKHFTSCPVQITEVRAHFSATHMEQKPNPLPEAGRATASLCQGQREQQELPSK